MIRSYTSAGKKDRSAASYRLPLGDVVETCYSCGKDVHASELTYCWADRRLRWIHRACRLTTKEIR